MLLGNDFFTPFSTLIASEVFTRKRHEAKVNYRDALLVRTTLLESPHRLLYTLLSL